jgi:ribosomal protein S18 acetylase RimI-like enzyme
MNKKLILLSILVHFFWCDSESTSLRLINSESHRYLRVHGDCHIGLLSPEKWQLYKDLRLRMLLESPAAFGGSYEEEAQYSDEQWYNYLVEAADETRTILIFFCKDEIAVGMAGAKIGLTKKTCHKATLFSVYVLPEYRGLGIGKVLISSIIEKIQTKSLRKIEAIVSVEQLSAIRLYSRFNFLIEGTLRNFWCIDNKFLDTYCIGLILDRFRLFNSNY